MIAYVPETSFNVEFPVTAIFEHTYYELDPVLTEQQFRREWLTIENMNRSLVGEISHHMLGEPISNGVSRQVYEYPGRSDLVVKVEVGEGHLWQNIIEWTTWHEAAEAQRRRLAGCMTISATGQVLVQKRTTPPPDDYKWPTRMPKWLCDFKKDNYGLLDGCLVCHDYGLPVSMWEGLRMKGTDKADWK